MKNFLTVLSIWILFEVGYPYGSKAIDHFPTKEECLKVLEKKERNQLPDAPPNYVCSEGNLGDFD